MKYYIEFEMINGKRGRTQPFSSRMAAEIAEIMMPIYLVKSTKIIENPCDEAPYSNCNGALGCDSCEHSLEDF